MTEFKELLRKLFEFNSATHEETRTEVVKAMRERLPLSSILELVKFYIKYPSRDAYDITKDILREFPIAIMDLIDQILAEDEPNWKTIPKNPREADIVFSVLTMSFSQNPDIFLDNMLSKKTEEKIMKATWGIQCGYIDAIGNAGVCADDSKVGKVIGFLEGYEKKITDEVLDSQGSRDRFILDHEQFVMDAIQDAIGKLKMKGRK